MKIVALEEHFLMPTVRRWPDRFEGFATIPTPNPEAAARELERAITTLGCESALFCRTRDSLSKTLRERHTDYVFDRLPLPRRAKKRSARLHRTVGNSSGNQAPNYQW
jgi:hypothetical protein